MNNNLSQAANGLLMQLVMDLKSGYLRRCESLGIKREEMQMLQRARMEQKRMQRIDRALALGSSIELMQTFFGLSSTDVAARRRIAGIEARSGRGNTLGDEDNAEIWRLWQKSGVEEVESPDGLDVMMLAAEQLNIPLTSVWHAVKGWHRTTPRRSVGQSPKPSVRKRA